MKRTMLGMSAAAILLASTTLWAGGGTWTSDDGSVHVVPDGQHAVFFSTHGANEFNLADLADGETRTFGEGDRQITVHREGEIATITRDAAGEAEALDVTCELQRDTCTVMQFDDSDRIMISIAKTRECVGGEGDCTDFVFGGGVHDGGHLAQVVVDAIVDCQPDGESECEDLHEILAYGGPAGHRVIRIETTDDGEGAEHSTIRLRGLSGGGNWIGADDDSVVLRCSEGDATLTVDAEEADDIFLCPKHSTPLERIAGHPGIHVIRRGTPHEHRDD